MHFSHMARRLPANIGDDKSVSRWINIEGNRGLKQMARPMSAVSEE